MRSYAIVIIWLLTATAASAQFTNVPVATSSNGAEYWLALPDEPFKQTWSGTTERIEISGAFLSDSNLPSIVYTCDAGFTSSVITSVWAGVTNVSTNLYTDTTNITTNTFLPFEYTYTDVTGLHTGTCVPSLNVEFLERQRFILRERQEDKFVNADDATGTPPTFDNFFATTTNASGQHITNLPNYDAVRLWQSAAVGTTWGYTTNQWGLFVGNEDHVFWTSIPDRGYSTVLVEMYYDGSNWAATPSMWGDFRLFYTNDILPVAIYESPYGTSPTPPAVSVTVSGEVFIAGINLPNELITTTETFSVTGWTNVLSNQWFRFGYWYEGDNEWIYEGVDVSGGSPLTGDVIKVLWTNAHFFGFGPRVGDTYRVPFDTWRLYETDFDEPYYLVTKMRWTQRAGQYSNAFSDLVTWEGFGWAEAKLNATTSSVTDEPYAWIQAPPDPTVNLGAPSTNSLTTNIWDGGDGILNPPTHIDTTPSPDPLTLTNWAVYGWDHRLDFDIVGDVTLSNSGLNACTAIWNVRVTSPAGVTGYGSNITVLGAGASSVESYSFAHSNMVIDETETINTYRLDVLQVIPYGHSALVHVESDYAVSGPSVDTYVRAKRHMGVLFHESVTTNYSSAKDWYARGQTNVPGSPNAITGAPIWEAETWAGAPGFENLTNIHHKYLTTAELDNSPFVTYNLTMDTNIPFVDERHALKYWALDEANEPRVVCRWDATNAPSGGIRWR
jgi:hypothetical protein